MKCTAYKVIPEWDNAFKSLLGSRHEGGTQWLLFSEKDQSLLELPWLFAIWTNNLSHAKWAIQLHPHLHYTARYVLWTIDRLWVRYLKKLNFNVSNYLKLDSLRKPPFPVDILIHYHTVELDYDILALIKLHHIIVMAFNVWLRYVIKWTTFLVPL